MGSQRGARAHREAPISDLSEDQRTDAPRGLSEEERRRALAEGTPRASSRYVGRFVTILVLLGVTGLVADYFFGQMGTTPAPHATTTAPAGSTRPLASSLDSLMGLRPIAHKVAPGFTLTDQHDHPWTLRHARGHVVVLTFFNANCADVCPVLGEEIAQAESLLGARAHAVDFVVVNTDPRDLVVAADPPALARTGLGRFANVTFLTGSVAALNPVWTNYGVTITVGAHSSQMAHNDVMYFIGPRGGLSDLATPFANESHAGVFSLGAGEVGRWAQGIAHTAGSLVP